MIYNFSSFPRRRKLPALSLAKETDDFFKENFRGIVNIHYGDIGINDVELTVEYLAEFFKMLLEYVDQKCCVGVTLKEENGRLIFNVKIPTDVSLSLAQTSELFQKAKDAGMSIRSDEKGFVLYIKLLRPTMYALNAYAQSKNEIKRIFIQIFYQ